MYLPKINNFIKWSGIVAISLVVVSFGYLNWNDDVLVVQEQLAGGITRTAIGTQTKWTTDLIPSSSFTVYLGSKTLPVQGGWFVNASTSSDFAFSGEIRPDGSICSNGQILKRTGTNDWDCSSDATGVASNSLNFDEFQTDLIVDVDTTITGGAFALTFDHASVSANFEIRGYASASFFQGSAFGTIDCNDTGEGLQWSTATNTFTCRTWNVADTQLTAGTDLTLTTNDLTLDSTLTQAFSFTNTGSQSMTGSLSVAKGFTAGANSALVVNGSATANTLNIVAGNVGIGTTDPSVANLQVVGKIAVAPSGTTPENGYNGNLIVEKPAASGQYINLIRAGNAVWSLGTVYNSSTFAIGSGNATDSSFTSPGFVMDTTGNVGIGTTGPVAAADIVPATTFTGPLFRVASGSSERFRITSGGNVGIGTTAPSTSLDVVGNEPFRVTGANPELYLVNSAGSTDDWAITGYISGVSNSGFGILNTTDNSTYLTINDSGNVGIGTTGPLTALEVQGAVSASQFFGGVASHSFGGSIEPKTTGLGSLGTTSLKWAQAVVNLIQAAVKFILPSRTTSNVNVTGALAVDTASSSLNFHDGTAERILKDTSCFSVYIEDPTSSNDKWIGHRRFNDPFTITSVQPVASGSNSAGWNIYHGVPGTVTTTLFTTNRNASTSTYPTYTAFNDATLDDGEVLDVVITSTSATLQSFTPTICGRWAK